MSKKIIAIAAAIILAAIGIVGGTLAWFTAEDTATNVLTTGNISITLTETAGGKAVAIDNGLKIEGIMPGDKIHKDPTITNTSGTEAAYIRARFVVTEYEMVNGVRTAKTTSELTDLIINQIRAAIDTTNTWLYDGSTWYYLRATLPATGANSEKLFDEIEFPGATFLDEYQGKDFNVQIFAEATQVANQALPANPTLTNYEALGWPETP